MKKSRGKICIEIYLWLIILMIIIRSWGTITFLLKGSQITNEDISIAKGFCSRRHFDLVYFPGIKVEEVNIYIIDFRSPSASILSQRY